MGDGTQDMPPWLSRVTELVGEQLPTLSTARTEHAFDNSDSAAIKLAGRISDHASGQRQPDHLLRALRLQANGGDPA